MALKYIGYKKKNKRYLITIQESNLFGLIRKTTNYIDSDSYFTQAKETTAFYTFPEMKVLSRMDDKTTFLNGCLRKILLDETGDVHLLGKNRPDKKPKKE